MQDHAKQGYIFGHLSLIQNLALDIPSRVATMRDRQKFRVSQKRDLGACNDTSLLGSGVESPLIFYTKK